MSDLRQRIADTLREHTTDEYGFCRKCTRYGSLVDGGDKHVADVLMSVLRPDTDTVAWAMFDLDKQAADYQGEDFDWYRRMAVAAINAWLGEP